MDITGGQPLKDQIEKQAIEEMAQDLNMIDTLQCDFRYSVNYQRAKGLYGLGHRKQSEWEGNGYLKNCSECGNVVNFNNVSRWLYKFCPNCGAKMKGGAEGE